MSYKEQIEALARETFTELLAKKEAYTTAEAKRRDFPQRGGLVDADYQAKAARAQADFLEAQEAWRATQRNLPGKALEKLAAIRREYAQEMAQRFAVDPSKLDTASLELLKSGIMKPGEYVSMFNRAAQAGNTTMTRMIAKYAREAGEAVAKKYGENDQAARELRAVGYTANIDPARAHLDAFDGVTEIFRRTVDNLGMISHWDELTAQLLEMLE